MLLLLKIKNIKVLKFKYLLSCSADVIELMTKYYCEEAECEYKDFKDLRTIRHNMKLSDIISDRIKFKTDKFKELLAELKSKVISSGDDFSKVFDFNGTFYTIGKGGIHSIDDSRIYDMYKDKCLYRDADVSKIAS